MHVWLVSSCRLLPCIREKPGRRRVIVPLLVFLRNSSSCDKYNVFVPLGSIIFILNFCVCSMFTKHCETFLLVFE